MSLIGVCLGADKIGGGPSIVLPFMSKGSLLNFLRKEANSLRPPTDADVTQVCDPRNHPYPLNSKRQ